MPKSDPKLFDHRPTSGLVRELERRGFIVRWESGVSGTIGHLVLESPEVKLSGDQVSQALAQLEARREG